MLRIESAFNVVEGVVSSSLSLSHMSISSSVKAGCFATKVLENVVELSHSPKQSLRTESDLSRPNTMSGSTVGLKPVPVSSLAPISPIRSSNISRLGIVERNIRKH